MHEGNYMGLMVESPIAHKGEKSSSNSHIKARSDQSQIKTLSLIWPELCLPLPCQRSPLTAEDSQYSKIYTSFPLFPSPMLKFIIDFIRSLIKCPIWSYLRMNLRYQNSKLNINHCVIWSTNLGLSILKLYLGYG